MTVHVPLASLSCPRLDSIETPAALVDVALARELSEAEGLHYQGVMFYPGHIRIPLAEQGPALAEVSRRLGTFLEALGAAGLAPGVVSGGSTPTLWRSHEVVGMNESRPGITPYFDRASPWMGVCAPEWAVTGRGRGST